MKREVKEKKYRRKNESENERETKMDDESAPFNRTFLHSLHPRQINCTYSPFHTLHFLTLFVPKTKIDMYAIVTRREKGISKKMNKIQRSKKRSVDLFQSQFITFERYSIGACA